MSGSLLNVGLRFCYQHSYDLLSISTMAFSRVSLPLFLISKVISASDLNTRAFTQAENLVLADCGIGTVSGHPTWSTSREVMYYPGDVWTIDGTPNRPTMITNIPWDGSYPWRLAGTKAKTPNGDNFNIVINPTVPDGGWAGYATHTYDSTALICWAFHQDRLYKLDDGKWCSSAYVCNHRSSPNGRPPSKTVFKVQPNAVKLYETNHKDILNKVDKAVDASSPYFCKFDASHPDKGFDIGRSCFIKFECRGAGKASVQQMATYLKTVVANSENFATYSSETTEVCVKWDVRPGHEGECIGYKDKIDRYVTLPQVVEMQIINAPPDTSPVGPSGDAYLKYTISCPSAGWDCKICKLVATGLNLVNGYAGAAVSAACTVNCG